jgi:hypothetical protein
MIEMIREMESGIGNLNIIKGLFYVKFITLIQKEHYESTQ